jgi:large conductance mechanosensitive channel
MLKGFKDFLMRGNVVDLAVAVVIGAAFAKIVDAFVSNIVNPLLARAGGGKVGEGLGIQLGTAGVKETFIDLGGIINAVIVFLMTAAVVYFIFVVPMNTIQERRKRGDVPAEEAPSDEVKLLTEIRDALKTR